jgi:hypothetical protein
MSESKSFAPTPDENKTPEERLAELERIWPLIQQKLAVYDRAVADVKQLYSLPNSLMDVKMDLDKSIKETAKVKEELKGLLGNGLQAIENVLNPLTQQIDTVGSMHSELKKNVENQLAQTNQNVENAKSRISQVLSEAAKGSEIQLLRDYLESKISQVSKDISALNVKHVATEDKTTSLQDGFMGLADQLEDVNTVVKKSDDVRTEFMKQITKMSGIFENRWNEFSTFFQKYTDEKIESLKNDLQGSSASLGALRSEIIKKLESITLDSSNAFLKANNNAQQVAILEKKIENIFLLLKKFELSK